MAEFFWPLKSDIARMGGNVKEPQETAGLSAMFTQKELIIEEQIEKEPSFSVYVCTAAEE